MVAGHAIKMYRGYDQLKTGILIPPHAIALIVTGPPGNPSRKKYIVF
jgi:hypothetical protein